ncbi:MAG TPA: pyridoxamine 5'-phosphate oxidase family protein [Caulobacteraceae bacterium]|jgi:general stress protein 26
MSVDVNDRAEVESDLWDQIKDARVGMLGAMSGPPRHFQPMTPYADRDEGRIWFFTRRDTELFKYLGSGREAMFIIQNSKYQACIAGRLTERTDRAKVEEHWNPVVASWYPEGKDDPQLAMVSFECKDAEIWLNQVSPVRFAWEVAKANATDSVPDMGDRASLSFN